MYAGKSTVIRALSSAYGWDVVSFGKYVRNEAVHRNVSTERASLQDLGGELLEHLGARGLTLGALQHAAPKTLIHVFDGVRHPSVHHALRSMYDNALLVFLDVPPAQRYDRYKRTVAGNERLSYSEFLAISNHPIEKGIEELRSEAVAVIDGAEDQSAVLRNVEDVLRRESVIP